MTSCLLHMLLFFYCDEAFLLLSCRWGNTIINACWFIWATVANKLYGENSTLGTECIEKNNWFVQLNQMKIKLVTLKYIFYGTEDDGLQHRWYIALAKMVWQCLCSIAGLQKKLNTFFRIERNLFVMSHANSVSMNLQLCSL